MYLTKCEFGVCIRVLVHIFIVHIISGGIFMVRNIGGNRVLYWYNCCFFLISLYIRGFFTIVGLTVFHIRFVIFVIFVTIVVVWDYVIILGFDDSCVLLFWSSI